MKGVYPDYEKMTAERPVWRQEDGPLTRPRRQRLRGAELFELSEGTFEYRTWTCVYVSDAVVLIDPAGGSGCRETARAAAALGRPLIEPTPAELTAELAEDWLTATGARVVLVAGCRASLLRRNAHNQGLVGGLADFMAGARLRHEALLLAGG